MQKESDFFEKRIDSSQVFSGKLLQVYRDTVILPNGNQSTREHIKHPGASVVIPYLGNNIIAMVRQYRYPVNQIMLELPAGKIDPGESPEETIRRELAEETGYHAKILRPVCQIHTCVGYSDELLYLYWADQLISSPQRPDTDETIEVNTISISKAMRLVYCGKITDAKTLIGLFWANEIIHKSALLKNLSNF
jgi:ADP-ribose pyrophosphatase